MDRNFSRYQMVTNFMKLLIYYENIMNIYPP